MATKQQIAKEHLIEMARCINNELDLQGSDNRIELTFDGRKVSLQRITRTDKLDKRFVDKVFILIGESNNTMYSYLMGMLHGFSYLPSVYLRETLAKEFSIIVNEEYSSYQLAEVRETNRTPKYKGDSICATQNYYDANMFMDKAFTKVVGREIDLQNPADISLWNQAWSISKKHEFYNINN